MSIPQYYKIKAKNHLLDKQHSNIFTGHLEGLAVFSICSNTGSSSSCFRFPVAILSLKSNNNKRKTCKTNLFFPFRVYVYVWYVYECGHSMPHSIYAKVRGLLKVSSCLGKASLLLHCILQASGPMSFLFLPLLSIKSADPLTAPGCSCGRQELQFRLCAATGFTQRVILQPPAPQTNSKEKLFTHRNIGLDSLQSFLCGSFW